MRFLVQAVSILTLLLTLGCGGGDGGSEPTTASDCRTEGNGCTGDFSCQLNADGAYECLPSNQGGAAGSGGNEAGAAGQGGDAGAGGNEAGTAGADGNAGSGGNEAGTAGADGGAGAGGNEAGAAGSGGIAVDRNCIRMRTLEGRVQQPGIVGMFFTVDDCNGTPVVDLTGDDFEVYEDDSLLVGAEAPRAVLNRDGLGVFVTLLLDMSASTTEHLEQVKAAASAFVTELQVTRNLPVHISIELFAGGESSTVWKPHSLDADTLLEKIATIDEYDAPSPLRSNINGAVVNAISNVEASAAAFREWNRGGAFTAEYVLVFTDGYDNASLVDSQTAIDAAVMSTAQVIGIGLNSEVYRPDELAALSEEAVSLAQDSSELSAQFVRLAQRIDLQSQRVYALVYCTPSGAGEHTVSVKLTQSVDQEPAIHTFDATGLSGCQSADDIIGLCDDKECGGLGCGACDELETYCSSSGLCTELDITFISIPGGTFDMGSDVLAYYFREERPIHSVTVANFEMSQSEVTVGQYQVCVDAGMCTAPVCNLSATPSDTEDHPVRCVTWDQAQAFAGFARARLPSEAEWEYAARSGGQEITYPWGNEAPDCNRLNFNRCVGTATPVCSYPTGNTAQGLCDMSGNVREWVEDDYHSSYTGAPADGSPWLDDPRGDYRVMRGGSLYSDADFVRAAFRSLDPSGVYVDLGFRLVRDAR